MAEIEASKVEASFFYTFAGDTTIHISIEDRSDKLVKEWARRFPDAIDVILGNDRRTVPTRPMMTVHYDGESK